MPKRQWFNVLQIFKIHVKWQALVLYKLLSSAVTLDSKYALNKHEHVSPIVLIIDSHKLYNKRKCVVSLLWIQETDEVNEATA